MKKFLTLLEELNDFQYHYLRNELGGNRYNPEKSHLEMFNSYDKAHQNRIVLPLETSNLNDKVDTQVKIHLLKNGWNIHNYHAGLASKPTIDRDGNPKLEIKKIGKVLQQTGGDKVLHTQPRDRLIKGGDGKPVIGIDGRMKSEKVPQSLLDFYNADKTRDSAKTEHSIVISRDLDDIGGMTSGRTWENASCMYMPKSKDTHSGAHHQYIENDLKHHTLVAYAVKKGDDKIENPVGRILIKKYNINSNSKNHTIYRTESDTYGNAPSDFKNQVEDLMKKHYPATENHSYEIQDGLYDDGRAYITPLKTGLHIDHNGYKNYNSRGELHDYVDEDGIKQPAVRNKNGGYIHYKNGLEHNEDGMSSNVMGTESYKINGQYHREGDLPSVVVKDGNNKVLIEKYYFGGVLHREGGKPTIIDNNGTNTTEYHRFGLEHNEHGFSKIEKQKGGGELYERRINGKLLSPDNDTPAIHAINYNQYGQIINKEEYHNEKGLHRDGDEPAIISEVAYHDKKTKTEEYYKNGVSYREGNKPHKIEHTKDNTKILHYSSDGSINRPSKEKYTNGKLTTQYYDHDRPDYPNEIHHYDNTYDYGKLEKYKSGTYKYYDHNGEYLNGNHSSGERSYYDNNDGIINISKHGKQLYTIFKNKGGEIHFIDHNTNRGHMYSPDSDYINYKYEGHEGNKPSGDSYKTAVNTALSSNIWPKTDRNVAYNVDMVRGELDNSQLPKEHTQLIHELQKRIHKSLEYTD